MSDLYDDANGLMKEVHDLVSEVFELQSEHEAIDYQMREKRQQIETIVRKDFDGKLQLPSFATVSITPDSTSRTVDTDKLTKIIASLQETAANLYRDGVADSVKQAHLIVDIANSLESCIKVSQRKGSMRIVRAK